MPQADTKAVSTAKATRFQEWPVADAFSARVVSLDVFRGVVIAAMILVTDPGTYSAVYPQLLHAQWNGMTATDTIFPSFLFIVGVAIPLSFASRWKRGSTNKMLAWQVLRRSAILIALGIAVNGFPDYDWQTLRLPGILQRIGACYMCGAGLYLWATRRKRGEEEDSKSERTVLMAVSGAILVFYYLLLKFVPVPGLGAGRLDSFGNLPAYLDRAAFGTRHMWAYGTTSGMGVTYDPEGILSTLPAIATLLIGIVVGEWIRTQHPGKKKLLSLLLWGGMLLLAGWLLQSLMPINKRLWTSTFVLASSGVSLLVFALLYGVVDLRLSRWWTWPALVFGTNAILAFVLSSVITTLTDRIHITSSSGNSLTLHKWAYQHLFATWLEPVHASLAYAIAIVVRNLLLMWPLYRKRIFLRV